MSYYSCIDLPVLNKLMASASWMLIRDIKSNSEMDWVKSCYTPSSSLAGLTDYKNHCTLNLPFDHYKELVMKEIEHRLLQIGNYYDIDGNPFDTVCIKLGSSGWSAEAMWSNGNDCYFTHTYRESARIAAEKRAAEAEAKKAAKKAKREAEKKKRG